MFDTCDISSIPGHHGSNNVEDNLSEALEHRNLLPRRELIFDWSIDHVGGGRRHDNPDVGVGLGNGVGRGGGVSRGRGTADIGRGTTGLQRGVGRGTAGGLARGTTRGAACGIGRNSAYLKFSTGAPTGVATDGLPLSGIGRGCGSKHHKVHRDLFVHRLIRLDFPRGSTGNLLNQLLGIGGLTEGQSYGNLNLGMPVSLP